MPTMWTLGLQGLNRGKQVGCLSVTPLLDIFLAVEVKVCAIILKSIALPSVLHSPVLLHRAICEGRDQCFWQPPVSIAPGCDIHRGCEDIRGGGGTWAMRQKCACVPSKTSFWSALSGTHVPLLCRSTGQATLDGLNVQLSLFTIGYLQTNENAQRILIEINVVGTSINTIRST